MKNKNKIITGLVLSVFSLIVFIGSNSVAMAEQSSKLYAYGTDTIAGYSALLSTSKGIANKDVEFKVVKPDGVIVRIPTVTNLQGIAKADLYDYHTRRSGIYQIGAYYKGQPEVTNTTFTVYPDKLSLSKSEISSSKRVAAINDDSVYISVALKDKYGNPMEGHGVNLISSRTADSIRNTAENKLTNQNGVINFEIKSPDQGTSVFSVVDISTGAVLDKRIEIAFMESLEYLDGIGGDFNIIPVAHAQDAGPLSSFEITTNPSEILPNKVSSITVTAKDADGATVENYTGEVHFSVTGENSINVTLPEDYEFEAEDLGQHTFSQVLKFPTEGSYKLTVTDLQSLNDAIDGNEVESTIDIEVGTLFDTPTQSSDNAQNESSAPVLLTPVAGTYSQNVQNITGNALPGANLRIFDNDQEIGNTQATLEGKFNYQTSPLQDGTHEIYVVTVDNEGVVSATSSTISITIDTTAPIVEDAQLTPSGQISAGEVVDVKIISEENLSEAALIVNQDISVLTASATDPAAYIATLQAPENAGEYSIDVLLADELGNESTYQDVATLFVDVAPDENETPDQDQDIPDEDDNEGVEGVENNSSDVFGIPPSDVFGLVSYSSNERVTLVWQEASDDGSIANYKIYFGIDPNSLDQEVMTNDDSTTWYIPGLTNGMEYYFAVTAIDNEGLESEELSEVVSDIPFQLESEAEVEERPDTPIGNVDNEVFLRGAAFEERVPNRNTESGPGLFTLIAGTGIASFAARKLSRKKKK
ncbi:hypothetical protein GF340_03720 [Candidatus Peregrinibacteria bacterium]|nr:hypothetical protein [Candidatus Peregrinibacteria bacterium]